MNDPREAAFRLYRYRVTGVLVVACSAVFLGGVWLSGLDLNSTFHPSRFFDPKEHVCLRTGWFDTTRGEPGRVELCKEWIDLTDRTGQTNVLDTHYLDVYKDGAGEVHAQMTYPVSFRLVLMIGFLSAILWIGRKVLLLLLNRYKARLMEGKGNIL
jgi:hypothetical protein